MHYLGEIEKNAGASLKYSIDCSGWLGAATLSNAVVTESSGVTEVSESFTATVVTVQISGGTPGTTYRVTATITSSTGEIETPTFDLRVV